MTQLRNDSCTIYKESAGKKKGYFGRISWPRKTIDNARSWCFVPRQWLFSEHSAKDIEIGQQQLYQLRLHNILSENNILTIFELTGLALS